MASLLEPILTLFRPIYLIYLSATFIPSTLVSLFQSSTIPQSWSSFKDHWFARFWIYFGPLSKENAGPVVRPLLSNAQGTVLDIGSGQGHFLALYDTTKISKVLAVEPNKSHHKELRQNAAKAGFVYGSNFEILDSVIETLETKSGIQRHSIDTIVTLQCLCSIPNPQILIPELRSYLKPKGGRWIVYEHVRRNENQGRFVARYQAILNYIWPEFFNGCNLTRDTKTWIERSGGWSKSEGDGSLRQLETDSPWTAIPSVCGVLVTE